MYGKILHTLFLYQKGGEYEKGRYLSITKG